MINEFEKGREKIEFKVLLKRKGITYKQFGELVGLSESAVKQGVSENRDSPAWLYTALYFTRDETK